ncbi:MAG: TonB-dependent receptor, partial [Chitinophagales bacterium]|nr:TonB-dependent receptor [Chitinophagales bacterium]
MYRFFSILLTAVLLLCGISVAAQGQNCSLQLKGKVIDVHTGKPMEDAVIHILEQKEMTVSDEYGKFTVTKLCKGRVSLHISHVGCEPEFYELELNRDTAVTFVMHHTESELDEVIVERHKSQVQATVDIIKLQGRALERLRGLSLGETLRNIPGLYALNTGSTISKPVIHGLQGNRIVIVNSGIRLEAQQWGSEHAPEIDPFLAQKITIIKGANSLRYGCDALGGVIVAEPDPLPDIPVLNATLHYVLQANRAENAFSATVEGKHRRLPAFAWRIQGTYKRGGNARTPRYWLNNTGSEEANASLGLGWNGKRFDVETFYALYHTRIGIMSAAHFGNLTDLQNALKRGNPDDSAVFSYRIGIPYQQITHHLAKVALRATTGRVGEAKCLFGFQHNLR